MLILSPPPVGGSEQVFNPWNFSGNIICQSLALQGLTRHLFGEAILRMELAAFKELFLCLP